ncbi:integrase arm-type DNA-binding domain-containing protein [Bradyrhizobium japonicum]|uniref:tyrosine-type recombinase/integrase n=1 Tax=Bradyrhizobium japonicum TaxID=375 RepID=UPI001BA599E6|nr:site-specific integrase [Bradyrhizobium japonicum]MBR0809354.1 integrase arm-type DNA-binding domain-containing protein [Bradyrhizobium japonicum]
MRTWDKLSATFVRGLKTPGKFGDGGGLMLQATPTKTKGTVTKAWLYRYQIDQRERYMGLGSASVVSLAEAREAAREARRLVARGIDPISHRDAERMAVRVAELHSKTFRECLDLLIASHGDQWRQKHARQYRNSMETYCKSLMSVAVADVDVGMILECIEPEWKRAPETMDRVRRRIGEVLGFAEVREYRKPGPLPTRWKGHLDQTLLPPRKLKPVVNHPAMHFTEVPDLFAKLIVSDAIPELCLAFTILTAVRSQESRGAKWSEIDFDSGIWTIPPGRMKKSREHRVPLSKHALALIRRLPRNGDYLFSVNGSKPIVAMSLRKALHRNGGEDFTVHGFRSAFRTWGSERTSAPRELLEIALAHDVGDATEQAYKRTDLIEKRRKVMTQWATHINSPPASADRKVVAFR